MRDRIAKNSQANWRLDVANYRAPLLEISQRVTLGGLFIFFHSVADNRLACLPIINNPALAGCIITQTCTLKPLQRFFAA